MNTMIIPSSEHRVRVYRRAWDSRLTKTRVYVSGPESRLPVPSWTNDSPEALAAQRAHNRDTIQLWRAAAQQALGAPGLKLTFSRKAGCGCGCSPGLIADRLLYDAVGVPLDTIYVYADQEDA